MDTLHLIAQPKEEQEFENKKQAELTENRIVWKSDNQGDKEETFIQTGRRGGEDLRQGGGWRTQQGGGLWNGACQAAASRPHKVVGGRPCGPTFAHR